MIWWGWMIIGLLLLGAELFIVQADFFLVFLGVAALLAGLVAFTMPVVPEWGQWLVFAVFSLISMVFFRKRVYQLLRREVPDMANDMLREELHLNVGLPINGTCRVELRGSTWTARNVGVEAIPPGAKVRVVGVDGITLSVEAWH